MVHMVHSDGFMMKAEPMLHIRPRSSIVALDPQWEPLHLKMGVRSLSPQHSGLKTASATEDIFSLRGNARKSGGSFGLKVLKLLSVISMKQNVQNECLNAHTCTNRHRNTRTDTLLFLHHGLVLHNVNY